MARLRAVLLLTIVVFFLLAAAISLRADGPRDNSPDKVRPIPPTGVAILVADRRELEKQLGEFEMLIKQLGVKSDARVRRLLPDVQIYAKAVRWALDYNEFFNIDEVAKAKKLLDQGQQRARQLLAGTAPWESATGLVVRGYVSKIDGSVQPYGLVVPEDFGKNRSAKLPIDIWFHGRGETLSELNFVDERGRWPGQFTPPGTIVLHPYGRFCNAFKFAGETDVFEALNSVSEHYPVDMDRVAVRGFSMGGAACWHFAVHYAGDWVAANPGAGFAETTEFLRLFQDQSLNPTNYERKLLHWYDATDWSGNLFNCPTIAYSGELDSQKQAADIMQQAMQREGLKLTHIIGPKTRHAYEPGAAKTVAGLMARLQNAGRETKPREVRFKTYTLKYDTQDWVRVDLLEEHWKRAEVRAKLVDEHNVAITTKNVAALTLSVPYDGDPVLKGVVTVSIDGQMLRHHRLIEHPDFPWVCSLRRIEGTWKIDDSAQTDAIELLHATTPHKRHNLQGPIDDAFMDSFIFVRPTGKSNNPKFASWAHGELDHAIRQWRRQFRGDARVKDDVQITEDDIRNSALILWGDPASNSVLRRVANSLPIHWDDKEIKDGGRRFSSADHSLILICRNPLYPSRYVVLNSGFTYREYDYLNNARQVPKLPDWAVVNLDTPPDSQRPGKIAAAGFFDESWKLK